MNKNISILILLFIFIRCSSNSPTAKKGKTIKVFENKIEHITADNLITDIQYIPLETDSNCIIGHIDKMLANNNRLYILDKNGAKKLFVFDLNGKFIQSIGKQGKGPDEYIQLVDFSVNEEKGEIVLLDNYREILVFDLQGRFIKSKQLSRTNFFQNLCCYKNDYYLSTSNLIGNADKYSIFKYSYGFDEHKLLEFSNYCDFIHPIDNPISCNTESLYYLDVFTTTLYEKGEDGFAKKYLFDFGGKYMPLNIANSNEQFFQNYAKYCFIQRYVIGDKYLFLQILNRAKYNIGIFDMKNDRFFLYKNVSSEKIAFRPPYCNYKSKFYAAIEPGVVLDNAQKFKQLTNKYLINANSNPIVFTYKFAPND